jgi:hypothetical protein
MNKKKIGRDAGTVWNVLSDKRCSWEELVGKTELGPLELACAIGWLAREDKVTISPERGILYFEVYHEHYY